jgi:hypothetical protein
MVVLVLLCPVRIRQSPSFRAQFEFQSKSNLNPQTRACAGKRFEGYQPQDLAQIIHGLGRIGTHKAGTDFCSKFTQAVMARSFKVGAGRGWVGWCVWVGG